MAGIRVISTTTVHTSNNNVHTNSIELSPWDLRLLHLDPIQKGLLFHLNPKPDSHTLIKHLKLSLSKTLDFFPPLAGRFAMVEHQNDNDTSLESTNIDTRQEHKVVTATFSIDCNNLGALFVEAMADNTTVADILDPVYVPPIVHSFFPLNGYINHEGTCKPLLGVQVTELVDGIFIGCTINHAAADGTSFWHFFNSWSEISRGLDHLSKPLVSLERWFPHGINRPLRIPFTKKTQHLSPAANEECEKTIVNNGELNDNDELQVRIFHFTRKKIADLKAKANESEAGRNGISSLQSVLALLWCTIIKKQGIDPQREIKYRLAGCIRYRVQPPLPDNYFGNAFVNDVLTMKASEVCLDVGFGKAARRMKRMVSSFTEEKINNMLESWLENPICPTVSSFADEYSLVTSGSPRFDMYGNDFGWGKPVAVRSSAAAKRGGKITLFAGAEEGSIDIEVCLPITILEAMGNDPEFMDFVN